MDSDRWLLVQKARKARSNKRYGARHQRIRAMLAPFVLAGLADCARCGEPIPAGAEWDLGHDDIHPNLYSGPEHPYCNRSAPVRNKTSRRW
jgi:hypothetical protein